MIGFSQKHLLYAAGLLTAVCIGWSSVSCRQYRSSSRQFLSKLRAAIQEVAEGKIDSFTMERLTACSWDGLYVFGPYTPQEEIDKALGFSWPAARDTGIEYSDAFCLLVFTRKNSVVRYYLYPRRDGDWAALSGTKKISPASAVFSVRRGKGGPPVVILVGN